MMQRADISRMIKNDVFGTEGNIIEVFRVTGE